MKLGILGGTFNPIHNSHLYIARSYAEKLELDRVLLIPTHTPPHKPDKSLAPPEDRLAMCRLAVEGEKRLSVCDYEIRRAGKSYTLHTLEYLREKHSDAELYFLMGADMFLTVQAWYRPERIFELAILCATAREPGELAALEAHRPVLEAMGARCRVLELQPRPLSSTQVRACVKAGEKLDDLVPPNVAQYIRERGLYRD